MDIQNKEHQTYGDEITFYDYWKVVVKRKKLIIGIFLISIISTAVINLVMPKIYRGEAVLGVNTSIVTPKEIIDIIGNRKEIVFTKNLNSIEDLKIAELKGSTDKLKVIIDSKNADTIENSFAELAEYLKNYPVIKKHLEMEKEKIKKQIENLSILIGQYDEFAKYYDNLIKEKILTVIASNPVELKQKVYDLKNQKLLLEKTLNNFSVIEMNQVYISKNPVKPQVKKNTLLSGVLSFFTGIFLSFFIESIDKLRKKIIIR
ncbi:MAG: hypothetical protein M1510_11195 [Nitrospirae bacterium]|nr:hypothetical protein [Nitrospirota bacterium]